ncbi:MAG: response regulator [Pirellulaceae bacterium]
MNDVSSQRRILVVDDSPVDRMLVSRILADEPGWLIELAINGQQALEAIRETPPDLVVTDLQMPEMDGLTLVNEIKNLFPNLPVILITAQGSEQIAADTLRGGATSYTPKSALKKDLLRSARYVLDLADHVSVKPATNRARFQQRFVLQNDCQLVMPLIEHLQNHMPNWSEDCRLQLGMAIGEAMVNAMHHGNLEVCSSLRTDDDDCQYYATIRTRREQKPFCDRRVNVQADFDQDEMVIRIADDGSGFNPDSVPDPTAEENLTKICGRGLVLIRSFMDEVLHNDRGNEITMIKRRS